MVERAMGSGVISFRMVSIPVKIFSSVNRSEQIRFNMLRKDGSRLKQQYISLADGEVIEREDRAEGYEFAKGQYVLLSDEEMKAMDVRFKNEIEIVEFVPAEAIAPTHMERVHYVGPNLGTARSYQLLKEAMRETGKSALARYGARGKQYLVLLHPLEHALIMIQLRYAEEIREFSDVEIPEVEIEERELKFAIQLVEQASYEEFHTENYQDEVRGHMIDVIEKRVRGQQIIIASEKAPETKIIDFMEALKASLAAQEASNAEAKERKKAPKAAAKKKAEARKTASKYPGA